MADSHVSKSRVSQRPSLSCSQCAKRKVRCSKTIPCTRCIDAGQAKSCHRESIQLVGRQRKHKNEVDFLKGLIDSISSSDVYSAQEVVERLRGRITTLETGISELGPSDLSKVGDTAAQRNSQTTSGYSSVTNTGELRLPALEEPDTLRSVVTIDDVAWGRQSKSQNAVNKHEVSLPPLSSLLPIASINPRELPDQGQARILVQFHLDHLAYFHNALHGPSFWNECEEYWRTGRPEHPLWLALYLSVLSVSAWSLPKHEASMHFEHTDPRKLSAAWYLSMLSTLYTHNFIEKHSIYAIQAIVISNLVVYVQGHSDLQTVLIATALRIAQCMGLDRETDPVLDSGNSQGSTSSAWPESVRKEVVRRVWWQLIIQDYFEIAFANRCIVPPDQFTTPMPTNCDDGDLRAKDLSEPTISSYCIVLSRLACLMPGLNAGTSCRNPPSLEQRYQRVLEIDLQMRDLVSTFPSFLKRGEPQRPHWPAWVPWARSTLTCSAADKIIMIHRPFLVKSFKDPLYAYTRVTCLSAALTILKEYERIRDTDVASIWIVPAFTLSAAIVVMLDLLHKTDLDASDESRRELIVETMGGLERDHGNVMAERGASLLRALLNREKELRASQLQALQQHRVLRRGEFDLVAISQPAGLGYAQPAAEEMEAWFSGSIPTYSAFGLDNYTFDNLSYEPTYS